MYKNGTYNIEPVKENDDFLIREFKNPDRDNSVGIAIDTDNYLLQTNFIDLSSKTKIKEVIMVSLNVEKSLVENVKEF